MNNNDGGSLETTLYVLKLKHGKYYVGSTNDLDRRFAEHLSGSGSEWTRRHPPIEVVDHFRGNAFLEDGIVYTYMSRYGQENVRGGTLSSVVLTQVQKDQVDQQLRHGRNQCFICGSQNHFANNCTRASGESDDEERGRHNAIRRRTTQCARCGRHTHTEEICFASRHENGDFLPPVDDDGDDSDERGESGDSGDSNEPCSRCGWNSHDSSQCYATFHVDGQRLPSPSSSQGQQTNSMLCTRCGRSSHLARDCFASSHVNGSFLEQSDSESDDSSDSDY